MRRGEERLIYPNLPRMERFLTIPRAQNSAFKFSNPYMDDFIQESKDSKILIFMRILKC